MFKTIIISYSTRIGGAGIAANNFKQLLSDDIAISQVRVISQDQSGIYHLFKRLISFILSKFQFDGNLRNILLISFLINQLLTHSQEIKIIYIIYIGLIMIH